MEDGHLRQTTEKRLMLFSGEGYPELSERIADRLDIDLGGVELRQFAGGEMYARYLDSVRGARALYVVIAADDDPEEGRALIPQIRRRAGGAKVIRADPRSTPAESEARLSE